jgi:hypothetical protein
MKTTLIMSAILASALVLEAQTASKPATVRIKKIENINGVEKITDTTFTTNDMGSIKLEDGTVDIIGGKDGEMIKTVIINNGDADKMKVEILDSGKLDEEIEKAMKEAGVKGDAKGTQKIVIINDDKTPGDEKGKHTTKMVVVKHIDVADADENDMKRMGKNAGEADGKLAVEKMNFYPNPSTGKFNLSFTLPEKGDTQITILNIDGKVIYKESLPNFSNTYDKEIDISKNAKGVYFVKVEQGKHAQVKKIILE